MKRGIKTLVIAFSIIILASFVYASLPSVPDIGPSSCVTYAQARATISSASGKTDAQLKSMGFCSGSGGEETNTVSGTPNSNSGSEDAPLGQVTGDGSEDPNHIQTSGIITVTNEWGEKNTIDFDELKQDLNNLIKILESCSEDIVDCDARCGSTPIDNEQRYDCYGTCTQDQIRKDTAFNTCLGDAVGEGAYALTAFYGKIGQYTKDCRNIVINSKKNEKACSDLCAPNYVSLCGSTCLMNEMKDWFAEDVCKSQGNIKSKDYFTKWVAAVQAEDKQKSEDQQNTNQGSNSFNTNSDRGRDEFGRMNPSIEGYLGDAYVVRSDGTKVIPGHELYLKVEDRVVSGKDSNINIIFSNAGKINLGHDTELRVGNALLDQFYLARGTFKSEISLQKTQKFEIDTPNAAIFVRGTEYIVDYNETTNTTKIYLNEGVLEINIKNKTTNLTSGNYLIIYANGTVLTKLMNSESWETLGNNFYNAPNVNGILKGFILTFFIIDLIVIVTLAFWMRKKIKNPDKKDKSTSKGTASLILGILGIILLLVPYMGIILSAVGFCLSKIQKANKPIGLATAGFVLGIMGLILNGIILIGMLFF